MTTLIKPQKVKTSEELKPPWETLAILTGLILLTIFSYGVGLTNKAVAEDFADPKPYLEPGIDHQFRPVFGALLLLFRATIGTLYQNPVPYHIFSLLIHIIATCALFFVARRLTGARGLATIIAGIFTLYPRNEEAVFWVAASLHSFMTACLLLTILFYLKWEQTQKWTLLASSAALFTLGINSSEAGAMGLLLLAAYELLWDKNLRHLSIMQKSQVLFRRLWPFGLVVIAYGLMWLLSRQGFSGVVTTSSEDTSFYHLTLSPKILIEFGGYLTYTLLPFIPLRIIDSIILKAVLLALTLGLISLGLVKGSPLLRFGFSWIILTTLPYALLVPFGNANRYFYLPAVGFAIALVSVYQIISSCIINPTAQPRLERAGEVLLLIYTLFAVANLHARAHEWHEAGDMIDTMLQQVYTAHPAIEPNTKIYFLNLPPNTNKSSF